MIRKLVLHKHYVASLLGVGFLMLVLVRPVHAQEVILAFEDVLGPSATLDGMARTQMLISGLRRADVPQAMFLVRTQKITSRTKPRLEQYDKTGHILVSHGHDHNLFKKVNLYAYEIDLFKANAALEEFNHYRGYFHFGYHAAGGNLDVRRKLQNFAQENGFQPVYINVKTHDAYVNQRYVQQVNNHRRVDMAALEKIYVNMVWDALQNYYPYTIPTQRHQPKIVLLLQENDLAAYFIAPLVEKIRAQGWRIAAPDTAFGFPRPGGSLVGLQYSDGYMAALVGIDLMARDVPFVHPKTIAAIVGIHQLFP